MARSGGCRRACARHENLRRESAGPLRSGSAGTNFRLKTPNIARPSYTRPPSIKQVVIRQVVTIVVQAPRIVVQTPKTWHSASSSAISQFNS